jgi:hypothetical protein
MTKPWFSAKKYGYGSGLPCSWEGWALLFGLFAAMALSRLFLNMLVERSLARGLWFGVVTLLIIGFAAIARAKTEGGWRWRNGG